MKRQLTAFVCLLLGLVAAAKTHAPSATQTPNIPTIYVDANGVMRWSDTKQEASFYGVNYTVPFAHAYRAISYLGLDRKAAIDKDVYHFARLGFNAYRIHIWDVEISDEKGNLVENDHLELLDYLIAKLRERDIRVVITAQTNFGNGYPERNQPTGGFSYLYDKCDVHANPEAIAAQERYIAALVKHVNPYTGQAYLSDPYIVGFEINNEPCHSGTVAATKAYIDRMLGALKKAGNRKPVFYNVSHNQEVVEAYYQTAVQGTTYQWYPTGLVAGRTRTGNFLPNVDNYHIPFNQVKGFAQKARLVYEFDPADVLYSYLYPAMARTFRSTGFQWITQFAYDPIDMAWANTEYQTHFLNLAYTPGKAISMKIAAEVARNVKRGESFGSYPADTLFGAFRVSYTQDLSEMNSGEKFYHSNHTTTQPVSPQELQSVAGCGNSPIVRYEGTGAYFIDRLESGVWRLEVMPDAVVVNDPFAKPSLKREVVRTLYGTWDMTLRLPDLGDSFTVTALNEGNSYNKEDSYQNAATQGTIKALKPGVYLLQRQGVKPSHTWQAESQWQHIRLKEYVAPAPAPSSSPAASASTGTGISPATAYNVMHQPAQVAEAGQTLILQAEIAGQPQPDSVIIYTDKISFWNDRNPHIRMTRTEGYTYTATIPGDEVKRGIFRYNMVVCRDNEQQTFPGGTSGNPLDWDYATDNYFTTKVVVPGSPVTLFTVTDDWSGVEQYAMPEWCRMQRRVENDSPAERSALYFSFESSEENPRFFLRKDIKQAVSNRPEAISKATHLCVMLKQAPRQLSIGFLTADGFTYTVSAPGDTMLRIPLTDLKQTATALLPHPYPVFLKKYFEPDIQLPFKISRIEQLEISFDGAKGEKAEIGLENIWLE